MMELVWKYCLDLAYIAAAVIVIVIFYKRGFVESLYRFGRWIFAGVICYFVSPVVSDWLREKYIYGWIFDWVQDKVTAVLQNVAGAVDIEGLIDQLPFFVKQLVDKEALVEKYGPSSESFSAVAGDFAESAAQPLASMLSNLAAYVIVFVLAVIALWIVVKILGLICKLPVLNTINKILGGLFGVLAAFVFLSLATYILTLIIGIIGSQSKLTEIISLSRAVAFFDKVSLFSLF